MDTKREIAMEWKLEKNYPNFVENQDQYNLFMYKLTLIFYFIYIETVSSFIIFHTVSEHFSEQSKVYFIHIIKPYSKLP